MDALQGREGGFRGWAICIVSPFRPPDTRGERPGVPTVRVCGGGLMKRRTSNELVLDKVWFYPTFRMAFMPQWAHMSLTAMKRVRSIVTLGLILLAFNLDLGLNLLQAAEAAPAPSGGSTPPPAVSKPHAKSRKHAPKKQRGKKRDKPSALKPA